MEEGRHKGGKWRVEDHKTVFLMFHLMSQFGNKFSSLLVPPQRFLI